jgi:hypothetical protein
MVAHAQDSSLFQTTDAVVDVVQAAERTVVARLDLARAQVTRAARNGALGAGFGVCILLGWLVLMAALVLLLDLALPLIAALAIVGGGHVVAGALGAYLALRPKEEE